MNTIEIVFVQSIIYYAVGSSCLETWLSSPVILDALVPMQDRNFVDLDPVFNMNIDEDYDFRSAGITRNSFCNVYLEWIQFCADKREKVIYFVLSSHYITLYLFFFNKMMMTEVFRSIFLNCICAMLNITIINYPRLNN